MALRPRTLVQPDHRAHEHVPRAAQHHHERPDHMPDPGHRVQPSGPAARSRSAPPRPARAAPAAAPAPARGAPPRARSPPHTGAGSHTTPPGRAHHTAAGGSSSPSPPPPAARRCNSWCFSISGQVTCRSRASASSGNHPAARSRHSAALTGGPARRQPFRLRRGQVLADRLTIQPQALRDLVLAPARMPVRQDLRHIDHVERSPCHRPPVPLTGGSILLPDGQVHHDTHAVPMGNNVTRRWGITCSHHGPDWGIT